ncbi:hypothetical protein A7Q09_07730 [Methylacidiphilum sp. Yel]|uniref:hypothetical protein n=1 Tax=Methylacidiphilum sp. Yel TaxID=1847730 RepID=UPI00106AE218|nr:hypothetical protein [Methylacidiphilum sp. Yel]TFE67988.1 hypothetical protein A7Q09_07730 [Methylacidiphilum sp. Yel]
MNKKIVGNWKEKEYLCAEESEEKELSKIVFPEDLGIHFNEELESSPLSLRAILFEAYFYQRLGKEIPRNSNNEPSFPAIVIDRNFFLSLLDGEYPLWSQMYDEAPEAWEEWFIIDNPKKPGTVILSMPIEKKEIGNHSIEFIKSSLHPLKNELLECCKKLSASCQLLYSIWEKRNFRFVVFNKLPKDFVNKKFRLEQIDKQKKISMEMKK